MTETLEELYGDLYNSLGRAELHTTMRERQKTGWTLEETVGQLLFGKPGRLIGGIWIASMDDKRAQKFTYNDFLPWARATGRRGQTNLRSDLTRFKDLGMITELPRDPKSADRTVWWARCRSPLWDLFIMADVVISELRSDRKNGERKHYQPSEARMDRMLRELLEIHEDTADKPPVKQPRPARKEAPARNVRQRGPNGELRCSRCKVWKVETEFSLRTDRKWLRKSRCKDCMAEIARTRYLSIGKVEALNLARLTFKVGRSDDMVGLTCVDCGESFVAGEIVHSDGRLHHDRCDQTGL